MVFSAVIVIIGITSGHFKWASTIIRNDLPKIGPAKSMCSHCHGRVGQVFGWRVISAGLFLRVNKVHTSVPSVQFLCHQMYNLAKAFIFTTPISFMGSSSSTLPCSLLGIMTLMPHIEHSDSIVNSNLHLENGSSCASTSRGQPSLVYK